MITITFFDISPEQKSRFVKKNGIKGLVNSIG